MSRVTSLISIFGLCILVGLIFLATSSNAEDTSTKYEPNWESLDKRPLPSWYLKAKVGIFIHWGVYAVPSFGSEWFWQHWKGDPQRSNPIEDFMSANFKPGFSYQDFAVEFTGEFFNAKEWADIIEKSGAKYVVLTSKHHEGYALWPSKYSFSWNSVDVGLHRDVIAELSQAIRNKSGIHFGLYHSLYEWYNPLWLADKKNNFQTQDFVNHKVYPEMMELVTAYKPEILWSDGEWEANSTYWRSEEFLSWLYNDSPVAATVAVNDRWGQGTLCTHGGFYTCQDRFIPGHLLPHKWENAMTIDKGSWGYNRLSNLDDYLTSQELINTIVETIALGGNILINVGPTKDGRIAPIFQDRLRQAGQWLRLNEEAIYESSPWAECQQDNYTSGVWYTIKNLGGDVYVIFLKWPKTGVLFLSCPKISEDSKITILGLPNVKIQGTMTEKDLLKISLPDKALVDSDYAWTLKIKNAKRPT